MDNLLSYCGLLVDARISTSEKKLPVTGRFSIVSTSLYGLSDSTFIRKKIWIDIKSFFDWSVQKKVRLNPLPFQTERKARG